LVEGAGNEADIAAGQVAIGEIADRGAVDRHGQMVTLADRLDLVDGILGGVQRARGLEAALGWAEDGADVLDHFSERKVTIAADEKEVKTGFTVTAALIAAQKTIFVI